MDLLLGTKYQTFIDNEIVIFRLLKAGEDNKYIFLDKNNKKVTIEKEEIDKFAMINIDAVMNIMVTKSIDDAKDVYICINKTTDLVCGNTYPSLILRQDIYSISKNILSLSGNVYVGDCLTAVTAPSNEAFTEIMEFKDIIDTFSIGLYVDDTMNEINTLLKGNDKIFNSALKEIKDLHAEQINSGVVIGYCDNMEELMDSNNFINNFRLIFNIAQLDFPIRLDNNCSEDGVITLNSKQIKRLEDYLSCYISDVSVLKYDKDIDISKLVMHNHIMVSDISGEIFLINYVIIGQYITEDTDDVMQTMMNLLKD